MCKKIITVLTLSALLVSTIGLSGCAKWTKLSVKESHYYLRDSSVEVYTADDTTKFHPGGARINYADSTITGFSRNRGRVTIPLSEVIEVRKRGYSTENIVIAAVAGVVAVGVVAWAITSAKGPEGPSYCFNCGDW